MPPKDLSRLVSPRICSAPRLCWLIPSRRTESRPTRLSLADVKRTAITADELMEFVFNVRVRNDGPLANVTSVDPWWLGVGSGEARFLPDGRVQFDWPANPDPHSDGAPMNPFAAMGLPDGGLGWELEMGGAIVKILFHGQPGPQELVCRHPTTWGWVPYPQGLPTGHLAHRNPEPMASEPQPRYCTRRAHAGHRGRCLSVVTTGAATRTSVRKHWTDCRRQSLGRTEVGQLYP